MNTDTSFSYKNNATLRDITYFKFHCIFNLISIVFGALTKTTQHNILLNFIIDMGAQTSN